MRLALVSYFDIGNSYGISDEVFPPRQRNHPPDILQVGIKNPLGGGIGCDLVTFRGDLVDEWRKAAKDFLVKDESELGWSEKLDESQVEHKKRLIELVESQPIAHCELTIYAVGTVLLWLEFDSSGPGLTTDDLSILGWAFEFAAYRENISKELRKTAVERLTAAIDNADDRPLTFATRKDPIIDTDKTGYREMRLLTAFTHLILCVDQDDKARLPAILQERGQEDSGEVVEFKEIGTLHYGWACCIVVAHDLEDRVTPPKIQIGRILECIRIAHVFLGTCESFEKLMLSRISDQIGGYVRADAGHLDSRNLNRLRTLALAVASLTDFTPVTACEEDQKYFALFEGNAHITERSNTIQKRCDVLYSAQLAESEAEEAERSKRMDILLALLAGLTVVSVFVDGYNFLQEGASGPLISSFLIRTFVLLTMLAALIYIIILRLPSERNCGRRS